MLIPGYEWQIAESDCCMTFAFGFCFVENRLRFSLGRWTLMIRFTF